MDKLAFLALADRVAAGEIKTLSIKQPYPHHIFYDGKDVENRMQLNIGHLRAARATLTKIKETRNDHR